MLEGIFNTYGCISYTNYLLTIQVVIVFDLLNKNGVGSLPIGTKCKPVLQKKKTFC